MDNNTLHKLIGRKTKPGKSLNEQLSPQEYKLVSYLDLCEGVFRMTHAQATQLLNERFGGNIDEAMADVLP